MREFILPRLSLHLYWLKTEKERVFGCVMEGCYSLRQQLNI